MYMYISLVDISRKSLLGVANGLGEQASTALFFASTSTLTFCHLRAASILKKRLASNEQIKNNLRATRKQNQLMK